MKVTKVIADNSAELHYEDNTIILVSYSVPVAAIIRNKSTSGVMIGARTIDKYSATTTKHINKFFKKHGFSHLFPGKITIGNQIVWSNEKELTEIMNDK
jgi:DeoR/GlpR family transcriptional regulator of sugar metabolism